MEQKITPINQACEILGSQSALARALGLSSPTVHEWCNTDRPVPIQQAVRVEVITKGVVTRQMLRPDDWQKIWPELIPAVQVAVTGQGE